MRPHLERIYERELEFFKGYLTSPRTVRQIAKLAGVSRVTVYSRIKALRERGVTVLEKPVKAPTGHKSTAYWIKT